jgi:hypothetical protein
MTPEHFALAFREWLYKEQHKRMAEQLRTIVGVRLHPQEFNIVWHELALKAAITMMHKPDGTIVMMTPGGEVTIVSDTNVPERGSFTYMHVAEEWKV